MISGTGEAVGSRLDAILESRPLLHDGLEGQRVTWQLGYEALRFVERTVTPGSRTLETGEGVSTLLFAAIGCRHICVTPGAGVVDRIRAHAEHLGISLDNVTFVLEGSEDALPRLDLPELDLVLIDGRHAFPAPFVDWRYTAGRLRVGGHCIVDDVQIWTGRLLRDFLRSEPEWELVEDLAPRSAIFRKLTEYDPGAREWHMQSYRPRMGVSLVPGAIARQRLRQARHALEMAREGDWTRLRHAVRRRLRG